MTLPRISSKKVRHLGRLLVSIDDLHALAEILWKNSPEGSQIEFHFNGGSFDYPDDIRSLSDSEISELAIRSPIAEVRLSQKRALIAAEKSVRELIFHHWAAVRQNTAAVRSFWLETYVKAWLCVSWAILMTTVAIAAIIDGDVLAFLMTLAAAGGCLFGGLEFALEIPPSCAIVTPLTMHELRQAGAQLRQHRQTTVIAVIGIVLAFAGVLITLLI